MVFFFPLFFSCEIFLGARSLKTPEAGQLWPNRKKKTDEDEHHRLLLRVDTGQKGVVL
jgi:hypothetical protein